MKKIAITFLCLLLQISSVFAAVQMKVVAINEFRTDKPSDRLDVRVLQETELGRYVIEQNSALHCKVMKIIDPKRGKRNATFFVQPIYYTEDGKTIYIEDEIYGKYSKYVLSKEELKNFPTFKVMKTAALAVGSYFIKGLSIAYSFGEGFVKNEQDGRLKSGVVNAYESSPLSYISEGEQLDIKVGDDFYLVFKMKDDDEQIGSENPEEHSKVFLNNNIEQSTSKEESSSTENITIKD